jgi:uncharacterized membrane protein (DUF485 family)
MHKLNKKAGLIFFYRFFKLKEKKEKFKDFESVLKTIFIVIQQYFSYIVVASFIGGGNQSPWRNPLTCLKLLTNFIT